MSLVSEKDDKQDITQANELEKKSILRIVGTILFYDSIVSFLHSCKNIFLLYKKYFVFGIKPNINPNDSFVQEIKNTRSILGVYILFTFFRLFFFDAVQNDINIEKDETPETLKEQIADFFIFLIYVFGILSFSYLGKLVSYFSLKEKQNRLIEIYFVQEFNFLFLIYFTLMLFGLMNVSNPENSEEMEKIGLKITLFCFLTWVHSMYTFYVSFRKIKSFTKFKRMFILTPVFITIISFFIYFFLLIFDMLKFNS